MNKKQAILNLGLSAATILAVDTCTKEYVEKSLKESEKIELLNRNLMIIKHHNKGLPMNAFDKHQKKVALVSLIALILESFYAGNSLSKKGSLLSSVAHGLIIGGAISNTSDRILRGYVVDYLSFKKSKAIYNISDFAIILGAVLAAIEECRDN